jgi:hypothetical protein
MPSRLMIPSNRFKNKTKKIVDNETISQVSTFGWVFKNISSLRGLIAAHFNELGVNV